MGAQNRIKLHCRRQSSISCTLEFLNWDILPLNKYIRKQENIRSNFSRPFRRSFNVTEAHSRFSYFPVGIHFLSLTRLEFLCPSDGEYGEWNVSRHDASRGTGT